MGKLFPLEKHSSGSWIGDEKAKIMKIIKLDI